MTQNLTDFLKERTKKEIAGIGDGLLDRKTDIMVSQVYPKEVPKIRDYITDFYAQNGYTPIKGNKGNTFSMIFHREEHAKAIVTSYFSRLSEFIISCITIDESYKG